MMKNLLTFASVAKKTTQLLSTVARLRLLLVMLLTLCVSAAWGAEITFTPSSDKGSVTTNGTTDGDQVTKSGFTITSSNGVMGNGSNYRVYTDGTLSITSTVGNITAISFTFSSDKYTGGLDNLYTGLSTASWSASATSQARITNITITYTPTSTTKYTVTLVPGSGSVTNTELEEPNAGEGVTLPTPTLDCGDWEFAGWKTTSAVTTETTTKPTLIAAGAYSPTSDITLYAVYQRTETIQGGGSGNYELVTSAPSDWSGTYLIVDGSSTNCFNGSLTTLDAGGNYATITISDNTITSTTTTDSYAVTISKSTTNGKYYIKTASGYYIGSDATDSSKSNELDASTSTKYDNSISISSNNVTIQGPDHILKFFYQTGQTWRFRFYKSTTTQNVRLPQLYKKSSGSSSTTYYHSTPSCSTETLVSLHPNGGTISDANWTLENGVYKLTTEDESITLPTITRDGYTFSHWDTQADDSGVDYDPDDIINLNGTPITLYAQWECTMASISISGAYALTQGQEFLLTAIAKDSEGNEIECPDDAIYTWQYWDGSNWQDVNDNESSDKTKLQYASCNVVDHCGKFRCIISYGDCIAYSNTNTQDDGYKVHVYHIKGFGEWSTPYPFIYDANTGEAVLTMELEAYTTYVFSIFGSSTQFFNGGTITANATDWVYGLTNYGNTKITTTIAGVYIFTLDYSGGESNNLKLDVTYPSKRIIYLEPNIWGTDPKFAVHAWGGNSTEDILMTKIDDCASRNIYYAEIDASQTNVIFIRGNTDTYDISNPWGNVWNQTVDLTLGNDNLFYVDNWHDANDYNKSNGYWTTFTPNYLVTFDVQGHGTAPEDQCIAENGTATTPTAPTATGYTFGGWYKEAGCTNAYDFSTAVTSSITLYAKWTANIHTLTWDVNSGNALTGTYTSGSVAYGTVIVPPTTPTRTGHTFNGWSPAFEEGTTMPDYDLTYTAQWKLIPTLSWSASSCTAALEADNDYPDLTTNPADLTGITYSSSNTSVATIDSNTGEITLVGVGETTITASFAGNGTYAPAEDASYTLNVVESNCRWVEVTDNTTLEDGDEVVITMTLLGTSYVLPNKEATNEVPEAIIITNTTSFVNDYIWIIGKNGNNLTFESYNYSGKFLTCNSSASDGVRVNNGANKTFVVDDTYGYLKNTTNNRYLGVHRDNIEWCSYALTDAGNFPLKIAGQTLKFYKRECLDPTEVWVEGNLTNVSCTPQLPQIIAKDGGPITLIFKAVDGYTLPNEVTVTNATKTWDQETGKLTISNPTDNVLVTINAVKLHTITWMVGSSSVLTEKVANATGVTQTPADPANDAIGNCANAFMGWSETPLGSTEGQSAPADLCTAAQMKANHTSVTGDKTFYAVFATTEGSATDFKRVTSLDELSDGTSIVIASTKSSKFMTYSTAFGSSTWSESNGKITATDNMIFTLVANGDTWKIQKGTNIVSYEGRATNYPYCKPLLMNSNIKDWILVKNTSTTNTFTFYYEDGDYDYSIEYYSNESNWYAYSNTDPKSNAYYALALYVPDVTYSNYVTQCCTDWTPTLTYSKTTLDSETNETATPTITGNTHNAPVSFESSNTSVLTVDANNGTITAVGAGKATMTATWAKTGDYCEKSITTDEITVNGNFLVTFHANDGSGTTTTQQIPSNTATALNANTFQRDGYTFQGWATSASGAKEYDDKQEVTLSTSGLDLYAVWQVKAYKITIGTFTGNGTITTSPANSANCDAQVTITATPAAHYTLASVTVTRDDNSQTVAVVDNKFTMPASDVTITAVFTENEKFAINYAIPTGGGTLTDNAPTTIYIDGSITLPGIKDGTISSEYSCEEFIGWTTNPANHEAAGLKPEPFYNTGASFSDVSEDVTFYPVYSRPGAGVGGTVTLTEEEMYGWEDASYGTQRDLTTCVGTWTTTGYKNGSHAIQLKSDGSPYVKFPDLSGNITQVVLNATKGTTTTTLTEGTFTLKTEGGTTIAFESVNGSGICTIPVTGSYTTAYLYSSATARITNIAITYGPPAIISTTLDCSSDVDECIITYDLNESFLAAGTQILGSCHNSTFKFSEVGTYTICSEPQANEYKLIGWNNQCDGKGSLTYTPGQEITSLPQNIITLYAQWAPEVIVHDSYEETKVYPTAMGGSITLNSGQYACDPKKYDFIGWTTDDPQLWQQNTTPPALLTDNGDGTVTFTPEEPSQVYAVYAIEDLANSDAFKLSSIVDGTKYYVGFNEDRNGRVKTVSTEADALTFYKEETTGDDNYLISYIIPATAYNDPGTKQYLYYYEVGSTKRLQITTNPDVNQGWTLVPDGDGYKFRSIQYNSVYLSMTSGNVQTNGTGNVFNMETVAEYKYIAKTNCSENVTITFVPGNGTMTPSTNPVTAKTGDIITLPTCTYEGWTFLGWVTENIELTELEIDPSRLYTETYEVGNSDVTLYAYYTQTPTPADFDGTTSGTWKMYTEVSTDVYKYALSHGSSRPATLSSTEYCPNATEWTFTNTGEANVYYIQDEDNLYLAPGESYGIEHFIFTSTPFTWKVIEVDATNTYRIYRYDTRSDSYERLIMSNQSGLFYHSAKINEKNSNWYHVTIGGCTNPVYTTDPQPSKIISLVGSPMITSTIGQTVKASQKLQLVIKDMDANAEVTIAADGLTFYDTDNNVVNSLQTGPNGSLTATFTVAYTPTVADNQIVKPTITITCGSTVRTFYNVSCRSLPATFAIVAKVGNMWYALPSQGLNSTDALVGYPVEVDNQNDPTAVTAVPENADWSLRQVYASSGSNDRFKLNGANIMFENNASPAKMLNASVSYNYLLTDAEYSNYYETNPGLYEWTPTTTDLETYTLTNTQRTDRTLNVSVNTVFGVHAQNVATNSLRFLPINDRYKPLALQVVEWKENSIVVMYNGDPEQTASVSVNGGAAQTTTLSAAQRDIAVYELAANGLATNPTQRLSITIGAEKLLLPIPYIVNSNTTDATLTSNNKTLAAVSDLVVLNGKTLTADAATASKYTFRNLTIYGGGSLIIPSGKGLGVNSLTLRAGGITDAGEYDYVYPQFELRGTFTNSAAKINYDYITDYDHWYHFVLPFAGDLGTIKYPTEFYGANVVANNTGSWQIKRYAGEIRATGNYDAWVDIETEGKTSTSAGQGYIFWGAPKKVSVNGGDTQRQKWGIQRITMSVTADDAETEKADKILTGLSSHEDVDNKSDADNDQGWNLIGNPYMVNLKDMATAGLHACKLVEVIDPATGKWNGQWEWNDETDIRYLTIPSDHFDTYTAKTVEQSVPLVPGRAFFVQLEGEANAITFAAVNRASLMPALLAENSDKPVDIETGIVLSNETLQDEVNFWIKDGKTNDYEYNADYPKTPNNNQFNIYGVHTNGDLSWVATGPEYAAESMPIGYQVPAAGTYMLSLSEIYNSDGLEALYITDHALSPEVTVDIMSESYEFSVNQAETNNERFTVSVRVKAKTENGATGLGNVGADGEQIHKFIYQDKIYILHHGVIYDATGKRVITINK